MTKQELKNLLLAYGDAIVNYRSPNSNKLKYNVCTLDFSTPYIKNKKNNLKEADNSLLVFCWDTDSFKMLKFENVVGVIPMSSILRNDPYV